MKYSATNRLVEGVEMSKHLSQQTVRSCSSSYGLVYLLFYVSRFYTSLGDIVFASLICKYFRLAW